MECIRNRSDRKIERKRPWRMLGVLLVALPCAAPCALAQALERQPGWIRLDTGLTFSRETLDSYWVTLVRRPGSTSPYQLSLPRHTLSVRWDRGGALQIETPGPTVWTRDNMLPRRPQFALAENSESLKTWLRGTGLIPARRCQAPVMKLRSTMSDGSSRADVALFARCTFD